MENILTLGKLLSLWFCFLLHSILFLISQTSYRTYKIISSYELARPIKLNKVQLMITNLISLNMYKLDISRAWTSLTEVLSNGGGIQHEYNYHAFPKIHKK